MKRLLGISAFVACAACGYDWTVGPAPADGGAGTDGSVAEAGSDAGGLDAEDFDGETCDGLTTDIGLLHSQLLACTSTCTQEVTDECNCRMAVVDATTANAQRYSALTAQYRQRGCTTSDCSSGCRALLKTCIKSGSSGICA